MTVCFNGDFLPADTPLLTALDPGAKWGEGLFETMKVHRGQWLLKDRHRQRLLNGLAVLGLAPHPLLFSEELETLVLSVCQRNGVLPNARVRLAVWRTAADDCAFSIHASPLPESANTFNNEGLSLCLFPNARKAVDDLSALKSASYLPYALAARYAAAQGADEALLLNTHNRLCETARANVFLIKDGKITTPPLQEGCVDGVMRRTVLAALQQQGEAVTEQPLTESDLLQADEVFLTNALYPVRWVATYKDRQYNCTRSRAIFDAVSPTIFAGCC